MPRESFTVTDRSFEKNQESLVAVPDWAREYAGRFERQSFASGTHPPLPELTITGRPDLVRADHIYQPGYYEGRFESWSPGGEYRAWGLGGDYYAPNGDFARWQRGTFEAYPRYGDRWGYGRGACDGGYLRSPYDNDFYAQHLGWPPYDGFADPGYYGRRGRMPFYPPRRGGNFDYGCCPQPGRDYRSPWDGDRMYQPYNPYGRRYFDPRPHIPRDPYGGDWRDPSPYIRRDPYGYQDSYGYGCRDPYGYREPAPGWYRRYQDRFDGRWDNDVRRTYPYDLNPHLERLSYTIQSMVGTSIRQYDPRVPENLGCARFVSAALNRAYGLPIFDANVKGLEQSLRKQGFVEVPFEQMRPGDVIIAHRGGGDYGHAAIYMGNGQIANNSSFKRRIAVEKVDKFYSPEFRQVKAYRLA